MGERVQQSPHKKIAALAVDRLIDRAGNGREATRGERVELCAHVVSAGVSTVRAMADPHGKQDIHLAQFLELLVVYAPESYAKFRQVLAEISAGGQR